MNMIVRRDPWSLLDQWHKELDNMFDPNRRADDTSRIEGSDWTPAVDIKEEGDRYLLKCLNHAYDEVVELSGMDAIHGVVTQKAGKRRKDRKRYD